MRARAAKRGRTKPEARPGTNTTARHGSDNAANVTAAANGFAHDFSRAPLFATSQVGLPVKLYVNTPGDAHEQEAHRASDDVMRAPNPSQAAGETSTVRPRAEGDAGGVEEAPPSVRQVLSSQGQPLDAATRGLMEPRFGRDLSDVRVHSDSAAADSAEALAAKAYTFGNHLVFAPGQYRPGTAQGDKLLAHELTHTLQAGRGGGATVRRDVVFDAALNPTAVEFRVGTELTLDFVKLAQTLAGDRKINDADLGKLAQHALDQRETVSDYERMFMAGLADAANVRKLKRARLTATSTISFPVSTISAARVAHVINLNRSPVPKSVTEPFDKFKAAASRGDAAAMLKATAQVEGAALKEIEAHAGTFKSQAANLIAFARAHRIELGGVLQAMLAAASDNSESDKVMAGIVYAVAAHGGSALKDDVLQGRLKVDGLSTAAFGRVVASAGNLAAFYVPTATVGGLKGDTIYIPTDFDINDLKHRSVVMHELRHAEEDKAASTTDKLTDPAHFVPAEESEARGYRAQARYILDQMLQLSAGEQQAQAKKVVAPPLNELVLVAAILEGQKNRRLYQPILEIIFGASTDANVHQDAAGVARLLNVPAARLERAFIQQIGQTFNAGTKQLIEGMAGESRIHTIFRF